MKNQSSFVILPKVEYQNSREYVYQNLRHNILNLHLEPGQKLKESIVANCLQVSRTPIREAILRLTSEGFLQIFPQVGTFVSKISLKSMQDSTFIREVLETSILGIAIDQFTKEDIKECWEVLEKQKETLDSVDIWAHLDYDQKFHSIFFRVAGNIQAWQIVKTLYDNHRRERLLFLTTKEKLVLLYTEHVQLLTLIEQKKKKEALELLYKHIRYFTTILDDMKVQFPQYLE